MSAFSESSQSFLFKSGLRERLFLLGSLRARRSHPAPLVSALLAAPRAVLACLLLPSSRGVLAGLMLTTTFVLAGLLLASAPHLLSAAVIRACGPRRDRSALSVLATPS